MNQPDLFDFAERQAQFNGPDYDPEKDQVRLTGQIRRVFDCMKDARYRTLAEIADITGDLTPSISAQLRHLRKPRFGNHIVDKRRRNGETSGLWEYRVLINPRYRKGVSP